MKQTLLITLLVAMAPLCSFAQSTADLVRIEAKPKIETDRRDIKDSGADVKTQTVTIEATLTGKPKSPETRVVKWWVFGKGLKDNDIAVIDSGEAKLELSAQGQQKFVSEPASTSSTPEHAVLKNRRTQRGDLRTTSKKVEGSGVKYSGWGIQVKDGETVVGEAFSGERFKAEAK